MMLRKDVYHWENQKIRGVSAFVQADHPRPCIVPLTISPCVPVAFVVGQLALH